MSDQITCILNLYRRPEYLLEQLNAIKNQTRKPNKIIIYKNFYEGIVIPDEIKNDKSVTIIESSENFGVWARFAIGLLTNNEYICVFDDDTIPGSKWLENCFQTIKKVNGLLGTIGIVYHNKTGKIEYKFGSMTRYGWDNPNEEIKQVDIVGHSWFFKREWLSQLWNLNPNYEHFFKIGEDIGFSCALQKIGINTYVPPHPKDDLEMFGSHPQKAYQYGCDGKGVSQESVNFDKMDWALQFYRSHHGFKCIEEN